MNDTWQGFPLSPQQLHLWRQQQAAGVAPFVQCAVSILGDLEFEKLRAALETLTGRYEVLRTRLPYIAGFGMLLQVVDAECRLRVDLADLTVLEPACQQEEVGRMLATFRDIPFDLKEGPLLRWVLVRLGASRHKLLLTVSAYCADRATLTNLVRKIAACYGGDSAEADAESLQYPVIAEWLNELLQSKDSEPGRRHWRKLGSAGLPSVGLPFENRSGFQVPFRPLRLWRRIDGSLLAQIERAVGAHGTSLEAFLLVCWQTLLARAAGQDEVAIGVTFEGRTYEELQSALGPLARTLPVRCRPDLAAPLASALRRTEESLQQSYEWQECFAWEDWLAEGMGGDGFFLPFAFELERQPEDLTERGLSFAIESCSTSNCRFELRLACLRRPDELILHLEYDPGVLPESWVAHLAEQLIALLHSALEHPEMPLWELSLVGPAVRKQLLEDFNRSELDFPRGLSVHDLFAQQAARNPDDPAVEIDGVRLSYRELDGLANRLAHRLWRAGVGPEVRVALYLERSLEMCVGILGTLKAGGCYVPIDPTYPAERVGFVLQDACPAVVLTQPLLAARLTAGRAQVICLDDGWQELQGESAGCFGLRVLAGQAAYVFYTSGSTGTPKGVIVSHEAIYNLIAWSLRTFPCDGRTRLLQKTAYSFDASVWEIFVPLLSGGLLVLALPGGQMDAAYLARACREHGITDLQLVPSQLRVLVEQPELAECRDSLKRVFCGGELLSQDLASELLRRTDAQLINFYGPTEAAVNVLFWICECPSRRSVVPLGRPLANTRIYILDRWLRAVPVGTPGEIHVGGTGLARGYLGRADLTAQSFVPDPIIGKPGERLYRTGDLARFMPDGEIEFLGRADHQVKIRGQRIELGEIESLLERHPAILQAVVQAREDEPGNQRLVGYVVPSGDVAVASPELRSWLLSKLPAYMVPSAFVVLERLPCLANGKVDRRALPAPSEIFKAEDFSAPRTATEELVAQIWGGLLGVARVGLGDNFFELGGHSLLATQVISRVRDTLGVKLPLRDLFAWPTVAELARKIDLLRCGGSDLLPPLAPVRREGKLPLSFAQQRLWSLAQLEPENPAYNVYMPVRLIGSLHRAALERALNEIVRRHEVLRTSFLFQAGEPCQHIVDSFSLTLPWIDLRGLGPERREEEARRLALADAQRPFDLERAPLFRPALLLLNAEESMLLFTMHHIVSDGWSMGVLLNEVVALYLAFEQGEPPNLPKLPIQYADFSYWQRSWLVGSTLEAHLAFWRRHLAGAPQALELPTDHTRPTEPTYRGERQIFKLSAQLSASIGELCLLEGTTPFMIFLATLYTLFYQYSGQTDIVIGSPIANRSRLETEGLIGFFVNTLALRVQLSGGMSFRGLLGQVRELVLDASHHQDLPLERLVEELQPERRLGRTPFYQVVFTMQNAPVPVIDLPRLTLAPVAVENCTAKFDLTFNIWQTDQGFSGSIEHSSDLFESSTIRKMWRHLEHLFDGIVQEPGASLDSLEIFSDEEKDLFDRQIQVRELESEFLF
jgi:amino acid adenylation domain-containing protein